ncbi:hypothetical protein AB0M19_06050 [Streptomyces sp. NPDC051920]|uniref:hypothetical protein n=1 Tax=Streptomyces sp. NPDC051920 TaxID=3155523 RepID=UPI003448A766
MLAVLLAPVGAAAAWVSSEINDGPRYERTVSPIARDPAVQDVIARRASAGLVAKIDVSSAVNALAQALKERGFPPTLVNTVKSMDKEIKGGLIQGTSFIVEKLVESEMFARAWDGVNRRAHDAAMSVLAGDGHGVIQVRGNSLVLDIRAVLEEVQEQLVGTTLIAAESIPGADTSVVLVRNDHLTEAREAARWLGAVGPWVPAACVAFAAGGIAISPSRRRALLSVGAGVSVMMIALLVALRVARQVFLDAAVPVVDSQEAAAAVYDALVRFLRESVLVALVVSLTTVIAAYLRGPSRGARAVCSSTSEATETIARLMDWAGWESGGFGGWLRQHRAAVTGAVAGAGLLALLLWPYPTLGIALGVLLIGLIILSILAVLSAAARAPAFPTIWPDRDPTQASGPDHTPKAAP